MWNGRTYGELANTQKRIYNRPISKTMRLENGFKGFAYGYTDAQYESLIRLTSVLIRLFPNIKPTIPLLPNGRIDPGANKGVKRRRSSDHGILGHWHIHEPIGNSNPLREV